MRLKSLCDLKRSSVTFLGVVFEIGRWDGDFWKLAEMQSVCISYILCWQVFGCVFCLNIWINFNYRVVIFTNAYITYYVTYYVIIYYVMTTNTILLYMCADDNIDETYGINVQFEESDDEVKIELLLVPMLFYNHQQQHQFNVLCCHFLRTLNKMELICRHQYYWFNLCNFVLVRLVRVVVILQTSVF